MIHDTARARMKSASATVGNRGLWDLLSTRGVDVAGMQGIHTGLTITRSKN